MLDQLHGGITEDIEFFAGRSLIDFSSNLNPFGAPEGLDKVLSSVDIESYPSGYSRLEELLATFLKCQPENLLIANGASEAFYFLAMFLKPRVTSLQAPSFSEYRNCVQAIGTATLDVESIPGEPLDIKRMYRAIEQSDLIFIGNPNNPDGRLLKTNTMIQLVSHAEEFRTTVIVDEAFIDFCGRPQNSLVPIIESYNNLIVVGSLTKIFSIAGLRFGFIASNKDFIRRASAARPPWPVSSATSAAVEFCLSNNDYYEKSIREINSIKEDFVTRLEGTGLRVYPSSTNYLLIKLPDGRSSDGVMEAMLKEGFLIRDCRSFGLDKQFIRLAVKLPEQNTALLRALKKTLAKKYLFTTCRNAND